MTTKVHSTGAVIEYTPSGADVSSGDLIVLGAAGNVSLGVALTDIADGETGSVAIDGAFTVAKVSAAVIVAGETVDYDLTGTAVDDNAMTPPAGDISDCAVALEDAGNGVTSIAIRLLPGNGTIT